MRKAIGSIFCIILLTLQAFLSFGCSQSFDDSDYVDINHIINPISGMPYSVVYDEESGQYQNSTDHIVSATVLSGSSMEGDSYSTAICVMGAERATPFIEEKISEGKITAALLFTSDKKMLIFGDLAVYDEKSELTKYKEYQLAYGNFVQNVDLPSIDYPEGSYSNYNECAFADTIEFEIYIFGKNKSEKDSIKAELMAAIETLDNQINAKTETSDIFKINTAAVGEKVQIGAHTHKLLTESKRLYDETDGAFNVAITPLSKLWNVDIDGIAKYRAVGSKSNWRYPTGLPSLESIEIEKAKVDLSHLDIIEEEGKYFATKGISGMELDLGAIAKGYAVDICAEILKSHGVLSAQLNISGNVYEYGNYFNSSEKSVAPWRIGVTDPTQKHDIFKGYVCAIQVAGDISIVTSGDYERFYSYKYSQ